MSCSKKLGNGPLIELLAWGRAELLRAGIDEAQEECERILMKLLGCARSEIYLKQHELEASGVRGRFLELVEKRTRRIPLAYLLNEADFWKETLFVDERCLIPRPETEILVEAVLREINKGGQAPFFRGLAPFPKEKVPDPLKQKTEPVPFPAFSFLDIGTGSGAIAVAILRACPEARGTLLDISGGALEVAKINLEKYGLQERATLVQGDILDFFGTRDSGLGTCNENSTQKTRPEGRVPVFDVIVSNPPYLSAKDMGELQEELKFEPRGALDGGTDGLDFYRRIIAEAGHYLEPGGFLVFEVGAGQAGLPMGPARSRGMDAPSSQAETVSKWLQEAGYDSIQRFKDHLQVQRVVMAQRCLS